MDNLITSPLRRLPGAFLIAKIESKRLQKLREKYHRPEVKDSTDTPIIRDAVLLTVVLHLVKLFWLRWMARSSFIELPKVCKKSNVITLKGIREENGREIGWPTNRPVGPVRPENMPPSGRRQPDHLMTRIEGVIRDEFNEVSSIQYILFIH